MTVAKNIEFKDRAMNCGAQLVRSVANDTNNIAGDGTTTATVLTRAIYAGGIKAVAAGMNPMDLKRGIDLAVEKVLVALKTMTQPISTPEEISAVSSFPLSAVCAPLLFPVVMISLAQVILCQWQRHNYAARTDLDPGLRCQC